MTHLPQEPCHQISKDDSLVSLVVVGWSGDTGEIPQIALPLVETRILASCIEEQDMGRAFDKPASIESFDTDCTHGLEGGSEMGIGGLLSLDLHGSGLVAERADETVSVTIFGDSDGDFCFYDCVDTADLVGDLPGALKQERVANVALGLGHGCRDEMKRDELRARGCDAGGERDERMSRTEEMDGGREDESGGDAPISRTTLSIG